MEENYLTDTLTKLQQASFPQEVFVKRKTLSKEDVLFMLNTFWNGDSLNKLIDFVKQKQKELYQYSIEMEYIDSSVKFEEFVNQQHLRET